MRERFCQCSRSLTNLKLARGLTPLLFNPPPWNLAAIPTPELIQAWPEGIDADQQELLLNLLAYHIFPLAGEKRSILERMGSLSKSQVAKLIESLSRERHQWLSITGENYWELLHLTLIAGIEWLVLLTQIGSGGALVDRGRAAAESMRAEWFDRAIVAYERSLSLRPDDADTLDALTSTLLRKWRVVHDDAEKSQILEAADRHIQKAMSIRPDTARYNFACVLAVQGRGDEALGELRRLLASHPEQREQVARDEDFASIANRPEFRELLGHDGQSK